MSHAVGHLEDVGSRHFDVQEYHVGPEARDLVKQFGRRRETTDHLEAPIDGELGLEPFHEHAVVIDAKHPDAGL
jgi:hypothetical protein